jgi:hypothetical protein
MLLTKEMKILIQHLTFVKELSSNKNQDGCIKPLLRNIEK